MPIPGDVSVPHTSLPQTIFATQSLVAKRLCITLIDPVCIAPLLTCHLIALNKNPGVRPISIGDTARRIMARAIISAIKDDVLESAGATQLCAGQMAGVNLQSMPFISI